MRRLIKWSALLTVIVLVGWGVFSVVSYQQQKPEGAPLGKVQRKDLVQRVTIAGYVKPRRSSIIHAPYDGYVKKLFVKLGDKVRAGAPLVSVVETLQGVEEVFPIRSPFRGQVVQILKSQGESVKKFDDKNYILRVDDLSKIFIEAKVPEIDLVKLEVGQDSVVKASAILERTFKARIVEIGLAAIPKDQWQQTQVQYHVKLEVLGNDPLLRPGMSVVVDVVTGQKKDVLTLEHEFIYRKGESYYVELIGGEKKDIEVGLRNEVSFEILDGLDEDEQVKRVEFGRG